MSSSISFMPDEKLKYVYQSPEIVYSQTLGPQNKRFDTLQPTNAQNSQDSFLVQQPQDYMNLRIKKRDVFKVTAKAKTILPTATIVGTCPGILIPGQNMFVDNFCLSKMTNSVSIKWGNSELASTRDERNPWLYEMKSATYDLEACEQYGLVPQLTSGMGNLTEYLGVGAISKNYYGAYTGVTPQLLSNQQSPTLYPGMQLAEKNQTISSNVRVRIMCSADGDSANYDPVFTDLSAAPVALFATRDNAAYPNIWVPVTVSGAGSIVPANLFYNSTNAGVQGVYYIEVTEYLMDDFLTTPYQKNKSDKCVKVTPASMINFNFGYDEKYISNGLFGFGFVGGVADFSDVIERVPAESRITIETFNLTAPPRSDYSLKILTFRPTRVEGKSAILASGTSTTYEIFDQSDTVLPPIISISADPQFYDGGQWSAINALVNVSQWNTFFPARITAVEVQIGQTTVTENISFEELQRMSADLINNPKLANWINCKGSLMYYPNNNIAASMNRLVQNRGCPFLLIDVARLALRNSVDCSQMVPNVEYPVPQTIKIKYTVQTQAVNGIPALAPLTYYPHVYKFFPYVYEQRAGQPVAKYRLQARFSDASAIINEANHYSSGPVDLTMVGNGWFDDLTSWAKNNVESIGRAAIKGVRLVENLTRDNENWKNVNLLTKTVSDVAKNYGYGSRSSALHQSKYGKH